MAVTKPQPKVELNEDNVYAEAEFSRGVVRDMPRSSIPVGGVYDAIDFMVDKPGMVYKRGGTVYQGDAMGANTGGVGFVAAPEFPTGTKILALAADGNLYDVTSGATSAGSLGITTVENPHLYVDKLLVAASDGITAPKKITAPGGTVTIGTWGGTPPSGRLVTVHLSRVLLANSAAYPNRIWFSPVPNPESTWDSDAYIDTNHFLTGIVPCQGVLVAFSAGHTERIVGDIPPATIGENMSVQPVGEVGCVDARSIAAWRGNVIFAGQGGIWVTNGVGFDSLIEKDDGSGISSYWREMYDTVAANGGIFAGGVYARDYYMISLSYGTTLVDTLLCYLPRKAWTRLSNVALRSFASSFQGANELYGGTISGAPGHRVLSLKSIFQPTASVKNDADGDAVAPQLQLRMIGEGIGLKAYGHGHLTYDMRDAASDNPTLSLTASTGIEADSGFSQVAEAQGANATFPETSAVVRRRFIVNRDAQTLNLKFVQTNASSQTEIYAVEQEVRNFNVTADGP